MLTSYAQNFEDVMLWRALGHVERGFYIDIGANHPVIDSVSLAFYQKGWRGLHVEPCRLTAAALLDARPDEEVLEVVVGADTDSLMFYVIDGTGLSTCDADIADQHAKAGRPVQTVSVPGMPLSDVLDFAEGKEVHWLKVDVEGAESAVIGSWLPSIVRPWIVLVEAVHPHRRAVDRLEWEPALLDLGYEFVYFDGINRFYVSFAHPELKRHLAVGPNVFDNFVLSGQSSAPFCGALLADLRTTRRELGELKKASLEAQAALAAQCDALRAERMASLRATTMLETRIGVLRRRLQKQQGGGQRSAQAYTELQTAFAEVDAERARLQAWCRAAEAALAESAGKVKAVEAVAGEMRRELEAMRSSHSWRLTAPLRNAKARLRRGGVRHPRTYAAGMLDLLLDYVRKRERLKGALMLAASAVPGLRTRLRAFAQAQALRHANDNIRPPGSSWISGEEAALAPRARQIYRELQGVREMGSRGRIACD